MSEVLLASDYGYGIPWLVDILIITIVVTTIFFVYVAFSTRTSKKRTQKENEQSIKYKLHKYNAERYWAIFVAGILVWFWILSYPWIPPVAFERALDNNNTVHLINITAGQWFWQFTDGGIIEDDTFSDNPDSILNTFFDLSSNNQGISNTNVNSNNNNNRSSMATATSNNTYSNSLQPITLKVGETVKFVARSLDVNHGFGVLQSSKSMDVPLFQMQVVPGYDNIFYFTFEEPGNYTVRCLEYCGWNHPFMVSQIAVEKR